MATNYEAYEHLERFPLDPADCQRLFAEQLECVVGWTNRDGWPVAVTHWFVWHDDRFWVTSTPQRKRVKAIIDRPQTCVVVSSAGTKLGPARTVTAKTMATIRTDEETRSWFARSLAAKAWSTDAAEEALFREMLLNTERVVIELEPVAYITYDALKMARAARPRDPDLAPR